MHKAHALVVSLLLAGAVAAGAAATLRTVHLGAAVAAPQVAHVPDAAVRSREKKLAAWSASLRKAGRAKPPALPSVPHFAPVVVPSVPVVRQTAAVATPRATVAAVRPRAAQQQPQVVYVHAPQPQQQAAPSGEHEGDGGDGGYEGSDD